MSGQPHLHTSPPPPPTTASMNSNNYMTVTVQRDYKEYITRFERELPNELTGKVTQGEFNYTIDNINKLLARAEDIDARSVYEECIGCLTFFSIFLWYKDKYSKCVHKITKFIQEQNKTVYNNKGISWLNPMSNGFLKIEILVQTSSPYQSNISPPFSSSATSISTSTISPTSTKSLTSTGSTCQSTPNNNNIHVNNINNNNNQNQNQNQIIPPISASSLNRNNNNNTEESSTNNNNNQASGSSSHEKQTDTIINITNQEDSDSDSDSDPDFYQSSFPSSGNK
ncbi:diacylglycerol kinase protein DgkA [Cavenderia fasciculata]|uniref:Ras modification protein ERF4 n=1 Tax=Cavenderia fasciculata TaxID=261658 RepID=F4Q6H3_CACFS|nr:diacylglycerol kinase protein DgkA [Cavenderia fasciculata]EGG16483.1 diacylglycerol kinase protein DgkA [Cavenderia fasciculata]|eukprot:XP_004354883.1 diacylglycerol kinase protein DgkA [Cavenderia fasciculata]